MRNLVLAMVIVLAGFSTWRARQNADALVEKVDSIYSQPELIVWLAGDQGKPEAKMASLATSLKYDRNAAQEVMLMNGALFVLAILLLVLELKKKSQVPRNHQAP